MTFCRPRFVRVVARPALTRFWKRCPTSRKQDWFKLARQLENSRLANLEAVFSSVDHVDNFTIFDIGGNKCRIIARLLCNLR